MAGMFLYCLKQTAKCIRTDEGNCHRRRIVEDKGFYKEWLYPRFERFYRRQGWTVDEELGGGEPASKLIDEPTGTGGGGWCPNDKTMSISHGTCTPFRRKAGSQLKNSFKRLKTARRPRPTDTAEAPPPQVGTRSNQPPRLPSLGVSLVPRSNVGAGHKHTHTFSLGSRLSRSTLMLQDTQATTAAGRLQRELSLPVSPIHFLRLFQELGPSSNLLREPQPDELINLVQSFFSQKSAETESVVGDATGVCSQTNYLLKHVRRHMWAPTSSTLLPAA